MVLRTIKKTLLFLLTLLLSFSLIGCNNEINNNNSNDNNEDEIVDKENEEENDNNTIIEDEIDEEEKERINIIYNILLKEYYSVLNVNIEEIKTVEELLSYTDLYTQIRTVGSTNIEKGETYIGLGLTITDHSDGLLVTDVTSEIEIYKDVFAGDVILKVDDITLKDLNYDDKTLTLKKELNETSELLIKRFNKEVIVVVETVEIPYPSVTFNTYNNVGYIKIHRFANETYDVFLEALDILEEENIESLIIDVRNNGGGYLHTVHNILKLFLETEEELFYLFAPKKNTLTPYYGNPQTVKKEYPISVLVNPNSASASEVLAATMQKFGYVIIGEKTYGKDVYQIPEYLPSPFKANQVLNLTGGYWLVDKNKSVGGGIYPDIPVYETGIRKLLTPTLIQEYKLKDSSPYIGVYQRLINLEVEGEFTINYFDEEFMNMVIEYQQQNNLDETGILDLATQKSLIVYYKDLKKNYLYDNLLLEAINYMESKINED